MPFLVLDALGSELSVILAIWSRPTMRSTVGYMKDDISLWAPSGVLHSCHKPDDETVKMVVREVFLDPIWGYRSHFSL